MKCSAIRRSCTKCNIIGEPCRVKEHTKTKETAGEQQLSPILEVGMTRGQMMRTEVLVDELAALEEEGWQTGHGFSTRFDC